MDRRREEIYHLNSLSVEEVIERAGEHLIVKKDIDMMHRFFAAHMCSVIESNNIVGKATAMIVPFGPVGQYPYFAEMVNDRGIDLSNVRFFFMDEYADENGMEIPSDHYLSFRRKAIPMFGKIDKRLLPDLNNVIFPTYETLGSEKELIASAHLDVTYGGVGIHGHLAFNEPADGIRHTDPRVVDLNNYTVTINAIREGIGGNLEAFPRKALTLGMNQLFSADKIVIFCRNGVPGIDWANTVLRLALFGTPGDDYPVTYLKEHRDWLVVTDEDTLKTPVVIR